MNRSMKTLEIKRATPRTGDYESQPIEALDESRPVASRASGNSLIRRVLLAGIMLMLAWLAFSVHNSLNEISAEMESIRANFLLSR